jgi:hypothetical protein
MTDDELHVGNRVRNKNPRYRTAFVVETLDMTRGGPEQGRIGVRYEVSGERGYVDPKNLRKISRHKEAK